jgi:hypothetical protein
MAGTLAGGRKLSLTIRAKYGDDFWKQQGAIGGRASNNGGFATEKLNKNGLTGTEQARLSGAKGGAISKRTKVEKK